MSGSEFYHEALVRRIRDRDDCDDDLRNACYEIEHCHEAIRRLEAQIERMRLADEEREAIGKAAVAYARREKDGVGLLDDGPVECGQIAATLRKLLDRFA